MTEAEIYKQFEKEVFELADKYSILRFKISTLNFDRDYRRGADGNFHLVSTKAIIRVLGKTSKVPIGEGQAFSTYEEAFEATQKKWSEYYRRVRANRTPEELAEEARRQRRYRERRKGQGQQFERQT